jgi:hypothetical protein
MSSKMVDFPDPVLPKMAIVSPGCTVKEIFFNA